MAATISYAGPFTVARVSLDSNVGDIVAVTVNGRYRRLVLTFKQAGDVLDDGGKFNFDATISDSAAIGNDHAPVPAGASREVILSRTQGGPTANYRLNLAGLTASGFCHVEAYEY